MKRRDFSSSFIPYGNAAAVRAVADVDSGVGEIFGSVTYTFNIFDALGRISRWRRVLSRRRFTAAMCSANEAHIRPLRTNRRRLIHALSKRKRSRRTVPKAFIIVVSTMTYNASGTALATFVATLVPESTFSESVDIRGSVASYVLPTTTIDRIQLWAEERHLRQDCRFFPARFRLPYRSE